MLRFCTCMLAMPDLVVLLWLLGSVLTGVHARALLRRWRPTC